MSKVTSFLSDLAAKAKRFLNDLLNGEKSQAKQFVHQSIEDFYSSIDQVTEVATLTKLTDYLQSRAGNSGLPAAIASKLKQLIALGIAAGAIDLSLDYADALTRQELTLIEQRIGKLIDGARL